MLCDSDYEMIASVSAVNLTSWLKLCRTRTRETVTDGMNTPFSTGLGGTLRFLSAHQPGCEPDASGCESTHRQGIFLFYETSKPALRPTETDIQRTPGYFSGDTVIRRLGDETNRSPPSYSRGYERVEFYLHDSSRLQGADRNTFSVTLRKLPFVKETAILSEIIDFFEADKLK
jgi:hypothetical protein